MRSGPGRPPRSTGNSCRHFASSTLATLKDGKEHRYWSISENRRTADGHRFQRQVICLGEINDRQKANWVKQIQVFDTAAQAYATLALLPEDRLVPAEGVRRCKSVFIDWRFVVRGNGERAG